MSNTDTTYFVALGGNMGQVLEHFCAAILALQAADQAITALSRLYRSHPQGGPPQDNYVNAVLALQTKRSPESLLQLLLDIEQHSGRIRLEHWGPRTLDLDLLAYGQHVQNSPFLSLPHPRMHQRNFVLFPLCDIAPDWQHPLEKQTARDMANAFGWDGIEICTQQWPREVIASCQT
ncbi:MAG: 2-amino-4-hydroxy-6-hydroxymethyldihydropteridine diphosphokinase [Mariprofundaceae bacterium]|nr:2-amino-4-hydroxy-6-hydroxymethyldihydropteridine diphosphokinase [Mariprofundaceae bacterium]